MAFRYLLPILLFSVCTSLVDHIRSPADAAIHVNFTLRRLGREDVTADISSSVDSFCDQGVDTPGNITLHTFYRNRTRGAAAGEWKYMQTTSSELEYPNTLDFSVSVPVEGEGQVQVAVLQLDHAGGHCDAWTVDSNIYFTADDQELNSTTVVEASCATSGLISNNMSFVNESSSSLRGFITHWLSETGLELCNETLDSNPRRVEELFTLPGIPRPQDLFCSNGSTPDEPFINLSFLIHWSYELSSCDSLNFFDEGIELSVRSAGDRLWTPLAFYTRTTKRNNKANIGLDYDDVSKIVTIRGYPIPVTLDNIDTQHMINMSICGASFLESQSGVQFRWLQTTRQTPNVVNPRDMWSLDDVLVTVSHNRSCSNVIVFSEDFETNDIISSDKWPAQRRATLNEDKYICNIGRVGHAVSFSNFTQFSLQSRMIATRPIVLHQSSVCGQTPTTTASPTPTPTPSTPTPTPTSTPSPTEAGSETLPSLELDPELQSIFNQLQADPMAGLDALLGHVQNQSVEVNETQVVYLASFTLEVIGNTTVSQEFSQVYTEILSQVTASVTSRPENREMPNSEDGSILLAVLDQFALNNHNRSSDDIISDMLELNVRTDGGKEEGQEVMAIEDGDLSLTIPSYLFVSDTGSTVYASSFLYRNMSGFLDNALPNTENDSGSLLLGPVLSSFLHSADKALIITNTISPPVRITFSYADSNTFIPTCVFWKFKGDGGSWDSSGCQTEQDGPIITCRCDHLTHFALLLSPGIETDKSVAVSLQVIGSVGVSISLVALTLTIVTFTAFRSLWSLRNYIHIHLCVSLFIAQLLFVVGVEPRGSEAACSAIAVLLHYFFLVTFMWMLMEGVVLYVALVKVFDIQHLKYGIAFTAVSYGVPLLYMALCVPLGLVLTDSEGKGHYGSEMACWLRYDTHFIWAFIAPVILIILINSGFFVMALIIMCRHQWTQTHLSKLQNAKHWLRVSASLVVVMGMTWIMGVLVFTEDLLPLAYIFTIFVAFQGAIIFTVLVLLSKQVRDTYRKWWKVKVMDSELVSKYISERFSRGTTVTYTNSSGTVSPTMEKSRTSSQVSGNEVLTQSNKHSLTSGSTDVLTQSNKHSLTSGSTDVQTLSNKHSLTSGSTDVLTQSNKHSLTSGSTDVLSNH